MNYKTRSIYEEEEHKAVKTKRISSNFSIPTPLFLFVLIIVIWFVSAEASLAQGPYPIEKLSDVGESRDFVVGPGKVEVELNPGQQKTVNLKVTNRMGIAKTFFIEIEDFTGSKDSEQAVVLLGDDRGPYSLKDYLKVPAIEFTLANGERATIPITISIPPDEEPGGLYGSIIISIATEKTGEINSAAAAIISRIGTLFFVKVPGAVEENGVLKEFRTKTGKRFFGKSPVEFEILYENTGNIHLNPYGEIRIKNILGKEVGTVLIDPWFALPDSLRLREVSWETDPLFGLYTAEAFINRGYQDIIDEGQFKFFVLPWRLALILFLAVLILVFVIRFFLKTFEIKKKTKDS